METCRDAEDEGIQGVSDMSRSAFPDIHHRTIGILAMGLVVCCTHVSEIMAQRDLPPEKGGTTYSLGMPPVYKGRSGFELQWA